VSKSAKALVPPTEPVVPFEEALHTLESIVETMETGDLPLEQLLAKFEEGARLARTCQVQLAAAEVRVQQLEKSLGGELTTRPVELVAEDDAA
jgi:exodeoxyribonuclease VII small subunit